MSFSELVTKYNPFDNTESKRLTELAETIAEDVRLIKDYHVSRKNSVRKYRNILVQERRDREKEQALFLSAIDHLDDLMWAKDLYGRYIMANKAFREKFCYGMSWDTIRGKTDVELSRLCKAIVGDDNHTFGDVCCDSDKVVEATGLPQQFLESGNIDGKLIKLLVNKSPIYDFRGRMFATCGTGRDVTEWYGDIEHVIDDNIAFFGEAGAEKLKSELNKMEFKECADVRE